MEKGKQKMGFPQTLAPCNKPAFQASTD